MITKKVSRELLIDVQEYDNDIVGVFIGWGDEKSFTHVWMTASDYKAAVNSKNVTGPECFKPSKVVINPEGKKLKKDYASYISCVRHEFIDMFTSTGGLDYHMPNHNWAPKTWMERMPEGYSLVWFSMYDHFMCNADRTTFPSYSIVLYLTENSYKTNELEKELDSMEGVKVLDASYCPGNGYSIHFAVSVDGEEFLKRRSENSWYIEKGLIAKLGIDKFKREEEDENDYI